MYSGCRWQKKYIEPVQLKALFEVWQKYLDTQLPAIFAKIGSEDGLLMVDAVFNFYELVDKRLSKSSSRVVTQFNKFSEKLSAYLQTCEQYKITSFFSSL